MAPRKSSKIWKNTGGDQEEVLSIEEKFGGYKTKVREII